MEGDWIVMDGCIQPDPNIVRRPEEGELAKECDLDDLNVEFCLPDTDRYGEKTRCSATRFDYGEGVFGSELPFARRVGADPEREDDGYVITLVTKGETLGSECWVFAATQIEKGPIARVPLPMRVPSGFHAKWVPGERIWKG